MDQMQKTLALLVMCLALDVVVSTLRAIAKEIVVNTILCGVKEEGINALRATITVQ